LESVPYCLRSTYVTPVLLTKFHPQLMELCKSGNVYRHLDEANDSVGAAQRAQLGLVRGSFAAAASFPSSFAPPHPARPVAWD
jgi:hypothetical protein